MNREEIRLRAYSDAVNLITEANRLNTNFDVRTVGRDINILTNELENIIRNKFKQNT